MHGHVAGCWRHHFYIQSTCQGDTALEDDAVELENLPSDEERHSSLSPHHSAAYLTVDNSESLIFIYDCEMTGAQVSYHITEVRRMLQKGCQCL